MSAWSLAPCVPGAIAMARVARLVFAACDPKGGAVLHGPRFFEQPTCHHRPAVEQSDTACGGSRRNPEKPFSGARRG